MVIFLKMMVFLSNNFTGGSFSLFFGGGRVCGGVGFWVGGGGEMGHHLFFS